MKGIDITLIGLLILSILPANNIIYSQENIPANFYYDECSDPSITYMVTGDLPLLCLYENKTKFTQPHVISYNSGNIYLDSSVVINEFQDKIIPFEETGASNNFVEESLELEKWMMDYEWIKREKIAEEEMELEKWMISPQNW